MASILKYIGGFFYLVVLFQSQAHSAECQTTSGSPYVYNFNYNLNSSQNYVGYTTGWQQKSAPGAWTAGNPCNNRETLYFSSSPGEGLVPASSEGGVNWYDVQGNDYIQIASQISVWNRVSGATFYDVPFKNISNSCDGQCGGSAATGSAVKVNFRIKRKFIGSTDISGVTIFNLYANNAVGQSGRTPVVVGKMFMTMVVPQSCVINAGQIVTVDFGNISTSAFKNAGSKAEGVTPLSKTINIKCNGIEAQASLKLRIQADSVSGNAIVSNNKDVGFVITDSNDKELTPNDLSSAIPFFLDENVSANVTIKVYPVSVTGNKPVEGFVTSLAYIRVDFA